MIILNDNVEFLPVERVSLPWQTLKKRIATWDESDNQKTDRIHVCWTWWAEQCNQFSADSQNFYSEIFKVMTTAVNGRPRFGNDSQRTGNYREQMNAFSVMQRLWTMCLLEGIFGIAYEWMRSFSINWGSRELTNDPLISSGDKINFTSWVLLNFNDFEEILNKRKYFDPANGKAIIRWQQNVEEHFRISTIIFVRSFRWVAILMPSINDWISFGLLWKCSRGGLEICACENFQIYAHQVLRLNWTQNYSCCNNRWNFIRWTLKWISNYCSKNCSTIIFETKIRYSCIFPYLNEF